MSADTEIIRAALVGVMAEDGEHAASMCPYCVDRIKKAFEAIERIEEKE